MGHVLPCRRLPSFPYSPHSFCDESHSLLLLLCCSVLWDATSTKPHPGTGSHTEGLPHGARKCKFGDHTCCQLSSSLEQVPEGPNTQANVSSYSRDGWGRDTHHDAPSLGCHTGTAESQPGVTSTVANYGCGQGTPGRAAPTAWVFLALLSQSSSLKQGVTIQASQWLYQMFP